MKKRLMNVFLGIVVLSFVFTGCSHQGTADEITVYGQVTKIDGDSITVALAKQNDEDDKTDKNITLTGKEQVITVSDKTEVEALQGREGGINDIAIGNIVMAVLEGADVKNVTIRSSTMVVGDVIKEGSLKGNKNKTLGNIELTGVLQADGISETSEDETVSSSQENESTVLVRNGGTLTMTKGKLTKAGATSSVDESNFYGVNAVFLTLAESESSITNSEVTSASEGSNAIFAVGEDALIHVSNVEIDTSGDYSRGLAVTCGGAIEADKVDIATSGERSAPIATGKGGGKLSVTTGEASSSGISSPIIYSSGEVIAEELKGDAAASQALVVEGDSSIILKECELTGAGENGVMLYQSTSGNAIEGTAELKVVDSTVTSNTEGPMFYITNTQAEMRLENSKLTYKGEDLVKVSGNSTTTWGTAGSNGGDLILTGVAQQLEGDITCDEISSITIKLTKESILKGAVNHENKGKNVEISLDKGSTWELTGDSYVDVIVNSDDTCSNIKSNGHTIYYDRSNTGNSWLNGKTIRLDGGGKIVPK